MATSTYPLVNLLHLRSVTQNQVPVNMEAGQIAFNLYNALNAANNSYAIDMFVGTGGNFRTDFLGTDLTAQALATAATTGEVLTAGKGWTKVLLSDDFTADPGSNLAGIAPTVVTKNQAIKELDKLLGLLPNLQTTAKDTLVNAINELNQFVSQLTAGTQYVGDFSIASNTITAVSASGVREGYTIGTLPAPIDTTERHYFIITDEGQLSGLGNVPTGYARQGDWIISDGINWKHYAYINDQAAVVQVAPAAPTTRPTGSSLVSGDLWFDSANLALYLWYDDGTSQQWVPASTSRDPIVASPTAPTPTATWPLWLDTDATDVLGNVGKMYFWSGTAWAELVSDVANGGTF
jgi:hypothetical protein